MTIFNWQVREDLLDKMTERYDLTREQATMILNEFEDRAARESSMMSTEVSPRVFARQRTVDE